jgi:chromosome segregation ATPase
LEENFKDLKYLKTNNSLQPDAGMKLSTDTGGLVESDEREWEARSAMLEEELAKLKKVLAYERNINENMRSNLEEAKKLHTSQMKEMGDDCLLANNRCRNMEDTIMQLRNSKAEFELRILQLKTQLDKTQRELEEALLKLKAADHQNEVSLGNARDLETLKRDLEKLDAANKALSHQLRETKESLTEMTESRNGFRDSAESLDAKCKDMEATVEAAVLEAKTATEQNNTTKKRFDAMETNIRVAMQERDALKTLLSSKEAENFQKGMTIEILQKEIQVLREQLGDAGKKAAADAMTNKKALEKAITGSVRLCVVAPTVNVHVNDTRHKFKSKVSQTGLKSFLEAEVFEKYCFLYKQASDNAAPTGGNIEAWLQQMLAQMQLSIENHVNSAMEGSSL